MQSPEIILLGSGDMICTSLSASSIAIAGGHDLAPDSAATAIRVAAHSKGAGRPASHDKLNVIGYESSISRLSVGA
jgi:hypothetical protein